MKNYIIGFLIVVVLVLSVLCWRFNAQRLNNNKTRNTTHHTTTKTDTITKFIIKQVPGTIDTLTIVKDNAQINYEVASIDTMLTDGISKTYLGIKYNELTNLFNIDANIISSTIVDSIFIQNDIVKIVKPKLISPSISIGSRLSNDLIEIKAIDINIGLLINGKYRGEIGIDNHKNLRANVGINF